MTGQDTANQPTHIAYADETKYNFGRYRGVALVTLRLADARSFREELQKLLDESDVKKLEWKKLRDAKRRFAAMKVVNCTVRRAVEALLRVDVLSWDTEDRRHKLPGRDDIENLQRMYYHLFKNVLRERWPDGSVWRLCPHRNTAMDWERMEDFLAMASTQMEVERNLFTRGKFRARLRREFRIEEIAPCAAVEEPLVQLADLFAGLAVYSRERYERYEWWENSYSQQLRLLEGAEERSIQLSGSDSERCPVLAELKARCRRHGLGVSLKTRRGLRTFDPKKPINFWWYEAQREEDKAPVRGG
jgi:hypothetical protein